MDRRICRNAGNILKSGAMGLGGFLLGSAINSQSDAARKERDSMNAANAKAAAAEAATPQVENGTGDTAAKRIGRAALISTSPLGVQTTDPTGRRKLLGNTY